VQSRDEIGREEAVIGGAGLPQSGAPYKAMRRAGKSCCLMGRVQGVGRRVECGEALYVNRFWTGSVKFATDGDGVWRDAGGDHVERMERNG